MTTSRAPRRGAKPSQVFDATDWRKLFADRRAWVVAARVDRHDGEATHFSIEIDGEGEDGGGVRTLYVDVVTIPGDIELRCKVGTLPVFIPPVGAEVYVSIPDGIIDFVPAIVGYVTPLGASSGLGDSRAVLALPPDVKLLVHDGSSAGCEPLVKRSEHNALAAYVARQFDASAGHVHTVAGIPGLTTTIVTGTADPATPVTPAPPHPDLPPEADGTRTLEVD